MDAEPLLSSPVVEVRDVTCCAARSGCGAVEHNRDAKIVLPRRGVFVVHRRGEPVVADAATALVLGADDEYRISHPADGGDACTVLAVRADVLEEALGDHRPRHGLLAPATVVAARVLGARLRVAGADPLEAEEAALATLAAIAGDLGGRRAAAPAHQRRIEAVRALLAADPGVPWRIDAIARAVHCSPFHLARQFRATTGESIARSLLRLRLALALERVLEGDRDLARLAADLGFASHSHLTSRFRAAFAATPREMRRIVTAAAAEAP